MLPSVLRPRRRRAAPPGAQLEKMRVAFKLAKQFDECLVACLDIRFRLVVARHELRLAAWPCATEEIARILGVARSL